MPTIPAKLKWHSYGAVDVALHATDERPDNDYCANGYPEPDHVLFAKYTAPISRPGWPSEYDARVFREERDWGQRDEDGNPETHWVDAKTGERVPGDPPRSLAEAELGAPTHLFDAAAVLLWHDYELFQAADAAMGDPYP